MSSLTYLNNPIQNCAIDVVQVDLESEDRSGSQYAFSMWGQNVLVGSPNQQRVLQRPLIREGICFL